jgi:hypothetical protein
MLRKYDIWQNPAPEFVGAEDGAWYTVLGEEDPRDLAEFLDSNFPGTDWIIDLEEVS